MVAVPISGALVTLAGDVGMRSPCVVEIFRGSCSAALRCPTDEKVGRLMPSVLGCQPKIRLKMLLARW